MFGLTFDQVFGSILLYAIIQTSWLVIKKLVSNSERTVTIWTHYQERAKQNGHPTNSVVECPEPKCAIFNG